MNNLNIFSLENMVYYKKNKSKVKTLLISEINIPNFLITQSNFTIRIAKIQFELNHLSDQYGLILSLLANSIIIFSSSPNPYLIKKHIVTIPGYLCKCVFSNKNLLECDIFFNNFFPNNIPHNEKSKIYLLIQFRKLIQNNLITNTSVFYSIEKQINETEIINVRNNLKYMKENEISINEANSIKKHDLKYIERNYIFIQNTLTYNISVMKIENCKLKNELIFGYICRGFWIKMDLVDYNKLLKIKLRLNHIDRFDYSLEQIEMLCERMIINNCVVFFLNFELDSDQWNLPRDLFSCKEIYLNSCNMLRINNKEIIFEFDSNNLHGKFITITLLYCNMFDVYNMKNYY